MLGSFLELHAVPKKVFEQLNSGSASFPRATATGGAWAHSQPREIPGSRGAAAASSPLHFPVSGSGLHHLQKNKTPKPVDFNFSFFFGSVSVFSFSDLLHRRSFFGLHLLLLRFRWPAVGRRRRWIQVVALATAIGG